ncbi:restriction endonuclease subunit S [Halomonas qinghailakensis]|uniref:Restriction endonuclease subunit S n=1 Tax=Halomonas qinghailakensis TaxID=2937790 RepID=A0AA46TMH8_9GAMM|nr:restriction endonuclease subunit S [Halomonas sp. ZZQ-149]UYO73105.1 restriction endonuclease subunit S [Halomonas sp. ZZQ-149]
MSAHELITDHLDLWTQAVTQKSMAGRGSNGKVKLTGIKKLRELILELAVRGKLVDQNSNDEHASVLLEKISQEKATLARQGKVKKPKRLPAVTKEDVPFELPNFWQWARIWEISELITSGSRDWAKYYSESGAIFITMGNLSRVDYKLRLDNVKYVSPPTGGEGARTSLQGGDLVVSITGDVGNLGLIPEGFGEAYINQHSCLVRISSLCRNRYYAEFLRSPCAKNQFDEPQRGVKNSFRLSDMGEMLIPIPPLEEQHRIVQKVDELMALCDRLEQHASDQLDAHETLVDTLLCTLTQSEDATELADNWARLAEHFDTLFTTEQSIDKLKQTILQLAVMGRLVEQDAGDESVAKLVERIKTDKALLIKNKKIKAQAKLKLTYQGDAPHQRVPMHWVSTSLDELSHVQGGIQKQPKRRPLENKYPYLRVADVQRGFLMDCSDLPEFELFNDELSQYGLKKGDILVVEGNGSAEEIGRCAIWDGRVPDCIYQNHLMRVRPIVPETSDYIALYLNSPSGIVEMKRLAVTSSGLYNLSVGKIRSIPVPLPPLAEQHRIVQKVDELMALCDHLKERLTQASDTRCQLAGAVVEGALEG